MIIAPSGANFRIFFSFFICAYFKNLFSKQLNNNYISKDVVVKIVYKLSN